MIVCITELWACVVQEQRPRLFLRSTFFTQSFDWYSRHESVAEVLDGRRVCKVGSAIAEEMLYTQNAKIQINRIFRFKRGAHACMQ